MPDIEPTPASASRRDRKAQAATGLVAAAPVRSARVVAAPGARRGWLIGGGAAVALIVAFSAVSLATSGSGGAELPMLSEAEDLRAVEHLQAPCALPAAGEANGAAAQIDACDETHEAGDVLEPVADDQRSDERPQPRASAQPHTPDDADSEPVSPNARTPDAPADPTPGAPSDPGPGTPAPSNPSPGPAPAPSQPAPAPAPAPSTPAPQPKPSDPPPPVHVPKALAFTGLKANSLLGLGLLSSYTLSLSGEPGSKATVWYGSSRAGSVTFNSSGNASITMGSSLINLGLSNPIIRVAYSDGTAGSEIQARRDSI